MNESEYAALLGERSTLERLIEETSEEEAIVRLSLQGRLADINEQIALAEAGPIIRDPARAQLTFSGRPVIDQHGIFAGFGMKAVNSFTEAVAAIAASLTGPLADVGPIPNREQNQLLITNVALGSFGFELEEFRVQAEPAAEQTPVELALERAADLLEGSAEADDDRLADAASDLDRRAIAGLRSFVNVLAENEAVCALAVREKAFRFRDLAQVRRSLERLAQDNLHEVEQELVVEFRGALPSRRTFEFLLVSSGEILIGKSAPAFVSLEPINDHRHQRVRARFLVRRVGNGKPSYRLLEMPDWDRDAVE